MVKIPRRLDELLPAAAMEKVLDVLQQPEISNKVREAMGRVGLRDSNPLDRVKEAWQQARTWLDSLAENAPGTGENPTMLNATGQLFGTKWASIPVSPSVAYGYAKAASHYQDASAIEKKAELATTSAFGNQATAWLTSTAEALRLLSASAEAADGMAIARADAVRIPGVGDVREMLAAGPHPLRDVGAANGATEEDWRIQLKGRKQMLLLSSPNGLAAGEAEEHRSRALKAAQECGARVVELLADAVMSQGLADLLSFPNASQRLSTGSASPGSDCIVLPLHILLGGPSGALVVGAAEIINDLKKSAEVRGCLMTGPALAAATVALQLSTLGDDLELGIAAQLSSNPENLKNRARRIAVQLSSMGEIGETVEIEHISSLGPAPWNRYQLSSWAVRLKPKTTIDRLEKYIRAGGARHGLILEPARERDSLLLNLRFMPPQSDHELVQALSEQAQEVSAGDSQAST